MCKKEVPILMCDMQKYFPTSFFNAQEHYIVHLLHEIEMCRTVRTRTMFPVENYLKVLKKNVKQMDRLEGSMIQGYMLFKSTI